MSTHKAKVVMVNATAADPDVRGDMEAEMLAKAGYNVTVLGWDRNGTYPKVEKRGNYTLHKIKLKAPCRGNSIRIILYWPMWWCVEFLWLVRRKWDVVHVANIDAFIPALAAAKVRRKPTIYDIYDIHADSVPLPKLVRWIVLHVEKFFMRFANALILTSGGHLERLGMNLKHNVIMLNNVVCKYVPGNIEPTRSDKFRLFYAGTLFKGAHSNLDKIIMAVREIKDAELVIAGYGDYVEELRETVKDIGNVEFIGKISHEDVLNKTLNTDLLFVLYDPILPINTISLPNKLFEAMAYGKPILVPDNTVLADFVRVHNCGVPVDCRSVSEIRDAIIKLKDNPQFYKRLASEGRKAFEKKYNWSIMEKRLLDLYNGVLAAETGEVI